MPTKELWLQELRWTTKFLLVSLNRIRRRVIKFGKWMSRTPTLRQLVFSVFLTNLPLLGRFRGRLFSIVQTNLVAPTVALSGVLNPPLRRNLTTLILGKHPVVPVVNLTTKIVLTVKPGVTKLFRFILPEQPANLLSRLAEKLAALTMGCTLPLSVKCAPLQVVLGSEKLTYILVLILPIRAVPLWNISIGPLVHRGNLLSRPLAVKGLHIVIKAKLLRCRITPA